MRRREFVVTYSWHQAKQVWKFQITTVHPPHFQILPVRKRNQCWEGHQGYKTLEAAHERVEVLIKEVWGLEPVIVEELFI